jgi:hypothetical protein
MRWCPKVALSKQLNAKTAMAYWKDVAAAT